ncbi:MAG: T9SS type A sorting domain-containing protein [Ignavibacteriaceae bacterium]
MRFNGTISVIVTASALLLGFLAFVNSSKELSTVRSERISGAYNALNFWTMARAYPNDDIPNIARYAAFEQATLNKLYKTENLQTTNQWQTIGPHNKGGRTNAIAFNPQNPNTMYLGSASGGLWRSYTGGVGVDGWHYVPTGFPVLGVSTIAIEPNDSNTIYIGTGEVYNFDAAGTGAAYRSTRGTYGIGILKTTDGGQTWTKSLDWTYQQQRGIWAVKINPLNPNTVWAATTEGTYRSYDAGTTWTQVHDIVMVMDLIINPVDTNIVITGNGNLGSAGLGLYRTSDGGGSWTKITSVIPSNFQGKIQLDIYNADPNLVYASIGNGFSFSNGASWLCRSTDAGVNWQVRSTVDYSQWQGWFSHDVAVNQSNPDELIIIGIGVHNSTNGGSTIVQKSTGGLTSGFTPPIGGQEGNDNYTHSDAHDVKQHPTDHNTYYIATDGGIFRTTDFGETFESHNGRYQTTQFYNGTSSSQTDSMKVMGGFQDNSTDIYSGDLAWFRAPVGGDGSWTSIDATNDNIMYASSQNLFMSKSTDGGNQFFGVAPPGGGTTAFIAPFRIFIGNSDIVYAGRSIIYKSTNGGNNWTTTNNGNVLDGNPALSMDISYQSSDKVYVGTAPYQTRSNIFRTNNGGTNWDNITGTLPDRFPADIAVDPNDDNIVYVTFYGFGTGHVFKSTNSGNSWTDLSDNLPDVPVPAVIVDPNNSSHVYIGTDIGVFVSTGGGGNWQDFNAGLPDAVQGMDLNITTVNNAIRVMTHGNGAYETKLLSQVPTNTGTVSSTVTDFKLEQNYPNPFNPGTKINFAVPHSAFINLTVYDAIGNEVVTLVKENKPVGTYTVEFNATGLSSGVYYYKLKAGNFVETKKMILLK